MPDFLWGTEESLARRTLLAPLLAPELLYRLGAWLHRLSYRVPGRRVRLPARVVSVGNLAVGGSAKTPVAAWLARELGARGHKVALLSRGHRGDRSGVVNVVSDGRRLRATPREVGDEPVWLARAAAGVPVLAGRSRVALGHRAAAAFGAEVLILDDGFQHHRLHRDVDLVCLDAGLGLGNRHLLPRGPLREPPSALRRADAILWTRVGPDGRVTAPDGRGLPDWVPQFRVRLVPRALRDAVSGEARPPDALRGRRVGVVAAIARPDRLRADLGRLGAEVVSLRAFPDHYAYRREDLQTLDPELDWVTTAKDAVKLPPAWMAGLRVAVLEEEVEPLDPSVLLEWLGERLARGGSEA